LLELSQYDVIEHVEAEATGALDDADDSATAPDDQLDDDEYDDGQPAIVKQQPLGERLW